MNMLAYQYIIRGESHILHLCATGADPGFRRGGGVEQEFRLENRSYPGVHDFSLRMQVIIANDYRLHLTCAK